jgi:Leucine-rich repeat (LRR) protein
MKKRRHKPRRAAPHIVRLSRRKDLDQETAFTICKLIDHVGSEIVQDWDWDWLEGKRKNYRTLIKIPVLEKAWKILRKQEWLSLQTTNDVDKRISTITPLEGLTKLKALVLQNNLIRDIKPVCGMTRLTSLSLLTNRISDLEPLRSLRLLEDLALGGNPIKSLRILEDLPNLRALTLSSEQMPQFAECKSLPALRSLGLGIEGAVNNFSAWPDMPALKVLYVSGSPTLDGLQKFASLQTLHVTAGKFSDLSPLTALKHLTHCELSSSEPLDAQPLAKLFALRRVTFSCPKVSGLRSLSSLPALHDIGLDHKVKHKRGELAALRAELTSWDVEFKDESRNLQPSLDLQVVDQRTFDYYDSKGSYGVRADEPERDGMLSSERYWLLRQIEQALSARFEQGESADFFLPTTPGRRRTERVILYSLIAYESVREIVLTLQQILCHARNDWIIWFQSCVTEGPETVDLPEDFAEFTVWVYPNKIVATKESAEVVSRLIEWLG